MPSGILRALLGLTLLTACAQKMEAPPAAVEQLAADKMTSEVAPVAAPAGARDAALGFAAGDSPATIRPVTMRTMAGTNMIIRTGTAGIEIDSLERAVGQVRELASRVGGYIANSQMQLGQGRYRSAVLEIKVPASRFDELLGGLAPIGKVEHVNVSAEDVGEEFSDITARAANARRLEQRLIELIATRTGKLSDVLEIERELARVREEIERMEGRLRYLHAHAATSTLSVTVHEPAPIVGDQGSGAVLAEAFRQAWRNGVRFVATAIASLGVLVPLGLLVVVGLLAARKLWQRRLA
jgi:hypothetical protein